MTTHPGISILAAFGHTTTDNDEGSVPDTWDIKKSVDEWNGIDVNSSDGTVTCIRLIDESIFSGNQLDPSKLPSSLERLIVVSSGISGTFNKDFTSALPRTLTVLALPRNDFPTEEEEDDIEALTAAFKALPPKLEVLDLNFCGVRGNCATSKESAALFAALPRTLTILRLDGNDLGGQLDTFATLPPTLEKLELVQNTFTGAALLKADSLPRTLKVLNLGSNKFDTEVNWAGLPRDLQVLNLFNNELKAAGAGGAATADDDDSATTATILWADLPRSLTELNLDANDDLGCAVDWQQLPTTLVKLTLGHSAGFTGTVDWAAIGKMTALEMLELCSTEFTGPVDWAQLPQSLTDLNLGRSEFTGPVDCATLPRNLTKLDLTRNDFSGDIEVNFAHLPRGLTTLLFNRCGVLRGKLVAADLPQTLDFLDISHNEFSGDIEWNKLPSSLRHIYIDNNQFTGAIGGEGGVALPSGLHELHARSNQFTSLVAESLPARLSVLALTENKITGTLKMAALPRRLYELSLQNNIMSGTIEWEHLPPELCDLYLGENQFSGSVDWARLQGLRSCDISKNKFTGPAPPLESVKLPEDFVYDVEKFTKAAVAEK